MSKAIGQFLRQIRDRNGLTREQVCENVREACPWLPVWSNAQPSRLAQIESGEIETDATMIRALATACGANEHEQRQLSQRHTVAKHRKVLADTIARARRNVHDLRVDAHAEAVFLPSDLVAEVLRIFPGPWSDQACADLAPILNAWRLHHGIEYEPDDDEAGC